MTTTPTTPTVPGLKAANGPMPSTPGPWTRVMLVANLVGATTLGAIAFVAPDDAAGTIVPAGEPGTVALVGAMWASFGIASQLGWRRPERAVGIFAVQALYKAAFGIVALARFADDPTTVAVALTDLGLTVGYVLALREHRTADPAITA